MDILDQYGAVLVRQEMIQPVVGDEDLDYPVVDYPPELAAPPEPADDQPPELAYAEQKQRHLRQDHVPFAAWCRVCVQAKGRDKPHRRTMKEPVSALPLLGLDYCYLGAAEDSEKLPVLAGHLSPLGAGFSSLAKQKGGSDMMPLTLLVRWLCEFGITTEMRLRIDPEPSMQAIARIIATKRRPALTLIEETPVNSPASKGGVESYIAQLGGNVRALKLVVQERWSVSIGNVSAIFPWIVRHASWLYNRYQPLSDGITVFEKLHKEKYHGDVQPFRSRAAMGAWCLAWKA